VINENSNILEHIAGRGFHDPMRRALRLLLEGESYRDAASAAGIDHADLFRAARSVPGLRGAHLSAWRSGWGVDFPAMWQRHVERLAHVERQPRIARAGG